VAASVRRTVGALVRASRRRRGPSTLGCPRSNSGGDNSLVLAADLGKEERPMSSDGRPCRSGAAGAGGGDRVGGRRLEGVDGSMRAGASVARVVRDLEERRIKGEARRGSGIAWWKGEVKGNTRCQTGSRSVPVIWV
jgi:hypothetical protein